MAGGSLGFGMSDSSSTGRQGSETQFPKQFVNDLNKTLGGPLTIFDLFKLSPTPRSLFGYDRTQAQQPTGSFSLGFGPPSSLTPGSASPTAPPGEAGPTLGASPTPAGPTTPTGPRKYTLADLTNAYFKDPDKAMDLPRLFRQAGLQGDGFSYEDIAGAVSQAKKYGFSGRSQKNFLQMLADLQRTGQLQDTFAGGKGSGIF